MNVFPDCANNPNGIHMRLEDDSARLAGKQRTRLRVPSLLDRLLAYAVTTVMLALVLMFSVVVFSLLAAVALLVWGFLWWKMRGLRQQMEAQAEAQSEAEAPGGRVIEGEVIRDNPPHQEIEP